MSEYPALKNLINITLVTHLSNRVTTIYPDFQRDAFVKAVDDGLHDLELKPRFSHIADRLRNYLPDDYPTAVQILVQTLDSKDHDFEPIKDIDLLFLSIPTFVEKYGIDHFEESMDAMYIITRYSTCEFAIRPYIINYPDQTLKRLKKWATDESEHVRRLVSEGSRPRLPWAPQLTDFIADPAPTLALLDHLKDDPSLYVRRSVANHLNDISKDHPEKMLDILHDWHPAASEERLWLINHALRSLVKQGHPRALGLLGFGSDKVELQNFAVTPQQLHFGESLTITFDLFSTAKQPQNLMVDYIIHHMKANGKTAPKVFKLKKTTINAGETLTISKQHAIRPITTRKYYAGGHHVEIQVNGTVLGRVSFDLIMD